MQQFLDRLGNTIVKHGHLDERARDNRGRNDQHTIHRRAKNGKLARVDVVEQHLIHAQVAVRHQRRNWGVCKMKCDPCDSEVESGRAKSAPSD